MMKTIALKSEGSMKMWFMYKDVLASIFEGNDTKVFRSDEASGWQLILKCLRMFVILSL